MEYDAGLEGEFGEDESGTQQQVWSETRCAQGEMAHDAWLMCVPSWDLFIRVFDLLQLASQPAKMNEKSLHEACCNLGI